MSSKTKATLKRFARGLGFGVGASAVTYALTNIDALASVAPRYSFVVPVVTAGLLAADKWLRAHQAEQV